MRGNIKKIAMGAIPQAVSLVACFLTPILTQRSAIKTLKEFCQDNQTKPICDTYINPWNTNLTGVAGTTNNGHIIFDNIEAIICTFIMVLISGISIYRLLPPSKKLKRFLQQGIAGHQSLAFISCFLMVSAFSFFFFSLTTLAGSIYSISNTTFTICPNINNNLTLDCQFTFSNINDTEISNIGNLLSELNKIPYQAPQFIITLLPIILTVISTFVYSDIFRINKNALPRKAGLFGCCSKNPENQTISLNWSQEDSEKSIRTSGKTYGTF